MKEAFITIEKLISDFRNLGIQKGMTLILHSSMRNIGWVDGDAQAVIFALKEILTTQGTLVMPTHSSTLSEPSHWQNPPAAKEEWSKIRESMPAFNIHSTLTKKMGKIPEVFRNQSGVMRSNHPQVSFAAWGLHAKKITDNHSLSYGLGKESPLARIYDLNGWILLLGVNHDRNTSLHLAEYKTNHVNKKIIKEGAPIMQNGQRTWQEFDELELYEEDFLLIGQDFERETKLVKHGLVGHAKSLLIPHKNIVDFATEWIEKNRH